MALKCFVFHGVYGNPEENWFPWLKKELEKAGHEVFVPRFPTPENQSLENWLKAFEKFKSKLDADSVLIGHSLGAVFALRLLELIKVKVKAVFLVSGFLGRLELKEVDALNASFFSQPFNWNKIKSSAERIILFHSNNDPFVPLKKGRELAEKLEGRLIVVENAGHFNKESGYLRFPRLLKEILKQ